MPLLDRGCLSRFTLTGQLANGTTSTTTLCPSCYDTLAAKADRLGERDGITDIRLIRSRRSVSNSCDRCRREAAP